MNKRLGLEITRAMTKAKLTSVELARRAEVGDSWVRQLRSGRIDRPGADALRRVARELGLDESVVLGMTDQLGASTAGAMGDTPAPAAYLARLEDLVGLVGLLVKQNADLMAAVGLAPQTSEARAALEAWVESTASRLPLPDADPASTTAR